MVRYCSVPQCNTYCTEPGVSFHFYPTDAERRRVWLVVLRSGKAPSKYAMVCSKHFDDSAFLHSRTAEEGFKRKRLRPDALPTRNLPKRTLDMHKLPRKPPDGLLKRCPCGQVLNTNDASQLPGWEVRREVSIQCDLQQMPPLPLPMGIVASAQSASTGNNAEEGRDHSTGKSSKNEWRFECRLCEYSTPKGYNLRLHLLTHRAEKLFECEVCPAAFKSLSSYRAHFCKHTGERLFQCDLCPYSTVYKSHELMHKKTHMNACTMCSYRTKSESSLRIHKHRHLSDKPFKCKVCSLGFTQKCYLENHMQQHSESELS